MSPNDAYAHLCAWLVRQQRVYSYSCPLLPDEYVTIEKSEGPGKKIFYKCISDHSTKNLGIIKEEDFEKMIMKEELKFFQEITWGPVDVKRLKTGNCQCGSWILKDSDGFHSDWCPKFFKGIK